MLDGLDDIAWEGLEGAYGPAGEVPGLLRDVAAGGDEAWGALAELRATILHQGSVCSATAPSVPFLAGFLDGGEVTAGVLWLLGDMADIVDPEVPELAEVRAAVTCLADRIVPLLADPDALVRGIAAYALAKCPARAADSVAALRARFAIEDDPVAAGNIVIAEAALARGGELVGTALGDGRATVRGAAALAAAGVGRDRGGRRPGLGWPGAAAVAAVRDCFAAADPWLERPGIDDVPVNLGYPWGWDPVEDLVENVPPPVVPDVVGAVLASSSPPVRRAALSAAHAALYADGPARLPSPHRERLADVLGRALADPDNRSAAVRALALAGPAASGTADALAASGESAAVPVLAALADPRWRPLAIAHLTDGSADPDLGAALAARAVPHDPALLAAVRARLASLPDDEPFDHDAHPAGLRPRSHAPERRALRALLASWNLAD
ncbi:hypothetical protein GCM10022221_31300 [Actinocorallia aurea]